MGKLLVLLPRLQLLFLLGLYLYLGTVNLSDAVAASFNDLLAHAVGYLILLCSGFLAFPKRSYSLPLLLTLFLFSLLIECIQYFLPYRSFSLLDLVANGVGLLVGLIPGWLLLPLFCKICQGLGTDPRVK